MRFRKLRVNSLSVSRLQNPLIPILTERILPVPSSKRARSAEMIPVRAAAAKNTKIAAAKINNPYTGVV